MPDRHGQPTPRSTLRGQQGVRAGLVPSNQ